VDSILRRECALLEPFLTSWHTLPPGLAPAAASRPHEGPSPRPLPKAYERLSGRRSDYGVKVKSSGKFLGPVKTSEPSAKLKCRTIHESGAGAQVKGSEAVRPHLSYNELNPHDAARGELFHTPWSKATEPMCSPSRNSSYPSPMGPLNRANNLGRSDAS